jgi:sec-independent protein translocase protein TatB
MEILGVGPMELILILIISLIILGPNDMVKAGRTIGRTLRRIVKSPLWGAVQETSRNLRNLPNRLMREAGLEEEIKDLKETQAELRRQVDEVMKVKAPLMAGARELDNEVRASLEAGARQIDEEVQTIGTELSASAGAIRAAAAGASRPVPRPAASQPSGLSAWTSPPENAGDNAASPEPPGLDAWTTTPSPGAQAPEDAPEDNPPAPANPSPDPLTES